MRGYGQGSCLPLPFSVLRAVPWSKYTLIKTNRAQSKCVFLEETRTIRRKVHSSTHSPQSHFPFPLSPPSGGARFSFFSPSSRCTGIFRLPKIYVRVVARVSQPAIRVSFAARSRAAGDVFGTSAAAPHSRVGSVLKFMAGARHSPHVLPFPLISDRVGFFFRSQ